jgi:NAD-dependent deacetylase
MGKKKLVVLSGAGISAESGISTFRDAEGLWEGHDVMEVASPDGWKNNQDLVLDFYNQRRRQLLSVTPNKGHQVLAALEQDFDVTIITQNVDHLHQQAGSSNVIHLHGELLKVRSTINESLIYDWTKDLITGDKGEDGAQLRPHIVWFGEMVPMIEIAAKIAAKADIFLVVGTSMAVYPAAGLIDYVHPDVPKFLVDPKLPEGMNHISNLKCISLNGTEGLPLFAEEIKQL